MKDVSVIIFGTLCFRKSWFYWPRQYGGSNGRQSGNKGRNGSCCLWCEVNNSILWDVSHAFKHEHGHAQEENLNALYCTSKTTNLWYRATGKTALVFKSKKLFSNEFHFLLLDFYRNPDCSLNTGEKLYNCVYSTAWDPNSDFQKGYDAKKNENLLRISWSKIKSP